MCHTNGILPMVALARDHGITTVFVPAVDAAEAALVEGMTIIPLESLAALVGHLRGETPILPAQPLALDLDAEPTPAVDFSAVRGQEHVKRALEAAAAGGHNVVMSCRQVHAGGCDEPMSHHPAAAPCAQLPDCTATAGDAAWWAGSTAKLGAKRSHASSSGAGRGLLR